MGWELGRAIENLWYGAGDALAHASSIIAHPIRETAEAIDDYIGTDFIDENSAAAIETTKQFNTVMSPIANTVIPAANWISDTALPATVNGFAYVGAAVLSPLDNLTTAMGLDIVPDDNYIIQDIHRRHADMVDAGANAIDWVVDTGGQIGNIYEASPERAYALAAQGGVNAFTSTVGVIGDLAYAAAFDYTLRPAINLITYTGAGIGNLGMEDDNKFTAWNIESSELFGWTNALNDAGQIAHIPENVTNLIGIDREGFEESFARIDPSDPNSNGARTLLYGPQAVVEVGAFYVVGLATAGVGGAVLTSVRATEIGAKTIRQVENADILVSAIKAEERLQKAEEKLSKLNQGGVASSRQLRLAEKEVNKAEKEFTKIESKAERIGAARAKNAAKTTATAETAKASATAEQVAANETATVMTSQSVAPLTIAQRTKNGWYHGVYVGDKFFNPIHSPKIELTAASVAFGLGVYSDIKQGETQMDTSRSMIESGDKEMIERLEGTSFDISPQSTSSDFNDGASLPSAPSHSAASPYTSSSNNELTREFNLLIYSLKTGVNHEMGTITVNLPSDPAPQAKTITH